MDLFEHKDSGFNPFLITPDWQVAQINFGSHQALENISRLDIHHQTDEAFFLIKGEVILVESEIVDANILFYLELMKQGIVYNIPKNTWHNIIMKPGSQVLIIENSNTHLGDFEFHDLSKIQKDELVKKVSQLITGNE